jgi:hypothetical protein
MFVFPDSDVRGGDSNSVDGSDGSGYDALGDEVNRTADSEQNGSIPNEDDHELPSLLSSLHMHSDDDRAEDGKLGFDDNSMGDDIKEEHGETREDLVPLTKKELKVNLLNEA